MAPGAITANGVEETTPGNAPNEPGLAESKAKPQMLKFPKPPTFTDKHEERENLKGRLAAAFRIFGKYGFDEGVAGHITIRDPVEPDTFWVNPFGIAFSLIKKSDLIHVNEEGEVIGGGECRLLNTAAFMIHSAIHQARPDVMAAAHSHSLYGRSFCTLGRKLDTTTQDSCAFHNDHVVSLVAVVRNRNTVLMLYRSMSHSTASFWPKKKVNRLQSASETKRQLCFRITVYLR